MNDFNQKSTPWQYPGGKVSIGGRVSRGRVTPTPTTHSGDHCSGPTGLLSCLHVNSAQYTEAELSNFPFSSFPFLIYLPIPSICKVQKRLNFMGLERQYILVRGITLHSSSVLYTATLAWVFTTARQRSCGKVMFSVMFGCLSFYLQGMSLCRPQPWAPFRIRPQLQPTPSRNRAPALLLLYSGDTHFCTLWRWCRKLNDVIGFSQGTLKNRAKYNMRCRNECHQCPGTDSTPDMFKFVHYEARQAGGWYSTEMPACFWIRW